MDIQYLKEVYNICQGDNMNYYYTDPYNNECYELHELKEDGYLKLSESFVKFSQHSLERMQQRELDNVVNHIVNSMKSKSIQAYTSLNSSFIPRWHFKHNSKGRLGVQIILCNCVIIMDPDMKFIVTVLPSRKRNHRPCSFKDYCNIVKSRENQKIKYNNNKKLSRENRKTFKKGSKGKNKDKEY